jgi:hypothetical protein
MDNQTMMETLKWWQSVAHTHGEEFLDRFAPGWARALHSLSWGAEFMHFRYISGEDGVSHAVVPMEKWFEFLEFIEK